MRLPANPHAVRMTPASWQHVWAARQPSSSRDAQHGHLQVFLTSLAYVVGNGACHKPKTAQQASSWDSTAVPTQLLAEAAAMGEQPQSAAVWGSSSLMISVRMAWELRVPLS